VLNAAYAATCRYSPRRQDGSCLTEAEGERGRRDYTVTASRHQTNIMIPDTSLLGGELRRSGPREPYPGLPLYLYLQTQVSFSDWGDGKGQARGPSPDETVGISSQPEHLAHHGRIVEAVPCLTPTENSSKLPDMIRIFCRAALWSTLLLAAVLEPRILPAYQHASPDYLQIKRLSGKRGGNLVVAVNADPSSFNRMLTALFAHTTVTDRISADLVHINRATMELEPALAKSWEVSPDGRSYTIHLRQGLRFSDGSPFSADDVLFTFQVLQDPKTGAYLAGQVEVDGGFPQITKIDQYTVRLVYQRPVGMGLRSLDSVPILPKSRLAASYKEGTLASAWGPGTPPGEIAGLGAFRLKEYRRGEKIVLERNPYYWKKDKAGQTLPYLDTITFLVVPDRNSETMRFQAGEIDLLNSFNPENYASFQRARTRGNFTIKNLGPGLAMDFLWFNMNPVAKRPVRSGQAAEDLALFSRREFREAVSCALDRNGIVRSVFLGLAAPQFGPISSGNKKWYDTGLKATPYEPSRARKLLAGIGLTDSDGDGILEYGRGRRPLVISLLTARGNSAREKMAQIIKDNLGRIGIHVDIQFLLPNELVARLLNTMDYQAILFAFTPTDVDPDLQTDLWYSSGKNHAWSPGQEKPQTAWEAEIDQLIAGLVRSLDPAARRKAFFEVQEIWNREMPAIPIVAPDILVGWSNRLGNLLPSILPPHLLWNAEEITKKAD
jgi:peptide/nickel transport system substrate-binding protein